jgi:hypothetical protein
MNGSSMNMFINEPFLMNMFIDEPISMKMFIDERISMNMFIICHTSYIIHKESFPMNRIYNEQHI